MRAFDVVAATPWAILPETLQIILEIANREHVADMEAAAAALAERQRALEPEGVAASPGTRIEGTRSARLRGATAVIPVIGPIVRYSSLFDDISGATSIEMLGQDFSAALGNEQVESILLHIDSPGGMVAGTGELADMIFKARASKPITAYVSHNGASAAYWIASAASRVVVAPTSLVGSIGVVAAVPDPTRQPGDDFEFVSSQSPRKRPDPNTKAGKSQIQATVDELADVFVASVARNRGVGIETVLENFGGGDVFVGESAVTAGLADEVGSYEQVLEDLNNPPAPPAAASAPVPTSTPAKPERSRAMSVLDNIRGYLDALAANGEGQQGDEGAAEIAPGQTIAAPAVTLRAVTPTPPAAATDDPRVKDLERRLAAQEAENRRIKAERIGELAAAFATTQINAGRAFPAEQAQIVALYTQAATDDGELGPVRREDGSTVSRVQLLTGAYEARQSHKLTTEQLEAATAANAHAILANVQHTPGTQGDRPLTDDEKDKLLALTPGGRATLAARKAGANGRN